jgi:secreted PhoX family phosphatase
MNLSLVVLVVAFWSVESASPRSVTKIPSKWKNYTLGDKPSFLIGVPGSKPGQLLGPTGLTVDKRGRVIVAEYGNSRVQMFVNGQSEMSINLSGGKL